MSRFETVTAPPTPGAGRRMSYTYFACGRLTVPNQPSDPSAVTMRPGGTPQSGMGNYITTGAPPAPQGGVIYKGRSVNSITSSAATGRALSPTYFSTPGIMPFQSTRGPGSNTTLADDFACWSASAILAFDAIPGAITGDIGLVLGVAARFTVRGAANQFAGMEIGPSNTGVISVFIRQTDAGPVTFNQPTPTQPNMTEFHLYEIRLLSATAANEAQAKFLIDGRLQFALNYGPGTVLPDQTETTGLCFAPSIGNVLAMAATTRMYHVPNAFTVKSGPTEGSLL